jgi:hypothetical protein
MAVTFNGSNISVYMNGILNASTTTAFNQTGRGYFAISTYDSSAALQPANVSVYNTHLYNRILSLDEIFQNYEALKSRYNY